METRPEDVIAAIPDGDSWEDFVRQFGSAAESQAAALISASSRQREAVEARQRKIHDAYEVLTPAT